MSVLLKNNAVSRLAASLTTGATVLSVTAGDGAKFPSPGAGDWFPLTLVKADGTLEIMSCTSRTGDVMTVARAQEGTAALAFSSGDRAELRVTAAALNTVLGGAGASPTFGSIELVSAIPVIDFHYGSSTADFTSRIASDAAGDTVILSVNSVQARFSDSAFTSAKPILAATGITSQNGALRARDGAAGSYTDYGNTGIMTAYNAGGTIVGGGSIWHNGNFNPSDKVSGDFISIAGFASNNTGLPYFRRSSDNAVYYLQPALGYTPVQSVGSNGIKLGWNGSRLDAAVDVTYLGAVTTDDKVIPIIASQGVGAVGTYAFCYTAVAAGPGTLVAGGNMFYGSASAQLGVHPPGTWRCMGDAQAGQITLFLRVS